MKQASSHRALEQWEQERENKRLSLEVSKHDDHMVPWEKKSTKYLNIIKREMMMVNIYECSSPIWHWPCIVSTDHVLFHLFILIVWSQCNFGRWGYRETKWIAQHHIPNKWWVRNLYPESDSQIVNSKTKRWARLPSTIWITLFSDTNRELPLREIGALNKLRKNKFMSVLSILRKSVFTISVDRLIFWLLILNVK